MRTISITYFLATLVFLGIIATSCSPYFGLSAKMDEQIERYGQRVAKQTGMKLLIVGDVTDAIDQKPYSIATYCISFSSSQPQLLDTGRIYAANLVENFWLMLEQEPEVRKYNEIASKQLANYSVEVPVSRIGYKIAFWDKDMNRLQKPYLAEIHFYHSRFRYYYANPETQEIVLAFEESYEEAIAFRNAHSKRKS